jgi:hypothetical protein
MDVLKCDDECNVVGDSVTDGFGHDVPIGSVRVVAAPFIRGMGESRVIGSVRTYRPVRGPPVRA